MKKKQFIEILRRYIRGTSTEEEKNLIETYYHLLLAKYKLEPEIKMNEPQREELQKALLKTIWEKIHEEEQVKGEKIRISSKVWEMAAVLTFLVGIGIILYNVKSSQERTKRSMVVGDKQKNQEEIRPGGNNAILTLSDGEKIALDSTTNGSLAKQGNVSVLKLNSGQLTYKGGYSENNLNAEPVYNTLSTPRGGQYEIVLPDGTKVWLNAASSLHYPVAFTGRTRTVAIEGEGYFDVAPDAQKPFIVQVGKVKVEVLGTKFDVNAYKDEDGIKTTLEDGSVRVMQGEKEILLKPGEDVNVDNKSSEMKVGEVNVAAVIAWKNGIFYFDNTNIKEIMAKVSRWYNVNVTYETTELSNKSYSGVLPRYSDVSALLKMLEMTGTIHFEIKDRTIIVMN